MGLHGRESETALSPLGEGCKVKFNGATPPEEEPVNRMFASSVVFGNRLPFVMEPKSYGNVQRALVNRQCRKTPNPDGDYFTLMAKRFLNGRSTTFEGGHGGWFEKIGTIPPVSFEDWNSRFPKGRSMAHVAEVKAQNEGVWDDDAVNLRATFPKVEKIVVISKDHKDTDPRAVSGADDAFNVTVGPDMLRTMMCVKRSFDGTDSSNPMLYALGVPNRTLCDHLDSPGDRAAASGDDQLIKMRWKQLVTYIEIDGSRHDSHMHSLFYWLKLVIYTAIWGGVLSFGMQWFMDSCVATRGATKIGWTYSHPYRVRSGDPDTSGGNTIMTHFLVWCMLQWMRELERDDVSTAEACAATTEKFLLLGYTAKVKITHSSHEVTFLSGCFYPVGDQIWWGPLPGRLLSRIGWSIKSCNAKRSYEDVAGVANSFAFYKFLPFIRVYFARVLELIPEQYRKCMSTEHKPVTSNCSGPADPTPETWDFIHARYGLSEADESSFRKHLDTVTSLPFFTAHYVVEVMVAVDC